jgi:hypothetical protein
VPSIASLRHNADAIVQRLDFVPLAMGCVLGVFAKGTAPVCSFRAADVPADYLRAAMGFFSFSRWPLSMDRLLDCRFGRAIIAPLWGGIPAHKLRGWQMSGPELIAKCTPEINRMQRQRNAQGLPALTAEQANRLRTVINARHAVLQRMRAGRQRTESHWVPLGLTILVFVLAFGVAVVSRIVRR